MISQVPAWARPTVEKFFQTGELAGATRREADANHAELFGRQVSDLFEQAQQQDAQANGQVRSAGRATLPGIIGPSTVVFQEEGGVKSVYRTAGLYGPANNLTDGFLMVGTDDGKVSRQVWYSITEGCHSTAAAVTHHAAAGAAYPSQSYTLSGAHL